MMAKKIAGTLLPYEEGSTALSENCNLNFYRLCVYMDPSIRCPFPAFFF